MSGLLCLKGCFCFRERKAEAAVLRVHHQQQGHVPPLLSRRETCSVLCTPCFHSLPWELKEPRASAEGCSVRAEEASRKLELSRRSSKRRSQHFAPQNKAAGQPPSPLAEGLCWKLRPGSHPPAGGAWGEEGASWRFVAAGGGQRALRGPAGWQHGQGSSAARWQGPDHVARQFVLLKDGCSSMFYKCAMSTRFLIQCGLPSPGERKLTPLSLMKASVEGQIMEVC